MNIYRNNKDKKLYTIEYLIHDIRYLNNNGFAGIYTHPYYWNGEKISYLSKNQNDCLRFVEENFKIVSYT